jgi:hypothetical protein
MIKYIKLNNMQLQIEFDYEKVEVPNPKLQELRQSDIDFMLQEFEWLLESDNFKEEDCPMQNFKKLKEP